MEEDESYSIVQQEDDDNQEWSDAPNPFEDYDLEHDFGVWEDITPRPKEADLNKGIVSAVMNTFGDNKNESPISTTVLPESAKFLFVNPGFTSLSINMTNYTVQHAAKVILSSSMRYIRENAKRNKKLKIELASFPIDIPTTSTYYRYISVLNQYIEDEYPIKSIGQIGIPIFKIGNNDFLVCGCCGISMHNAEIIKHAQNKVAQFQKFTTRKWSCCPWCDIDFDTDESALVHWFDEGHAIVACRNIIGETNGSVNDARLHEGLPLPYTPFVQAAISCFLDMAPIATLILCQRVTKIDIANTNELPACLSIEIANAEPSTHWLPDCSACNKRYYNHNVIHYSSIAVIDKDSCYEKQECGHYVPLITAKFIGTIGLSLFDDLYDKLSGKKKKYGCATYKTMAKKDHYDDEGPIRKRFATLFEQYRTSTTPSSRTYAQLIFDKQHHQHKNHRALMFIQARSIYDKWSGGDFIVPDLKIEDQNPDTIIEAFQELGIVDRVNDKQHKQKVKKKKKLITTTNCSQHNTVIINSKKYAKCKHDLGFLDGRGGLFHYDLRAQQEYRLYPIPCA